MKQKMTMIVLFIGLNTIAQIKFEKGYFISNNGVKTECLIKNEGWRNTPSTFKYKLSKSLATKIGTLKTMKEFGLNNGRKFQKHTVKIDRSSRLTHSLSLKRTSDFKEEELFLELQVEGDSNLYLYEEDQLIRFFYSTKTLPIEQLEYKLYRTTKDFIAKNRNYLKQLMDNLYCNKLSTRNVKYTKNSLTNYFIKYNNCKGGKITNYIKKETKSSFHLKGKIGGNFSSLYIENLIASPKRKNDFGNQLNLRVGLELEYILPFQKNKWALFLESSYQSYKSTRKSSYSWMLNTKVNARYSSIEILLGLRHYMYLNSSASKLFLNAGVYLFDFNFNSLIDYERVGINDIKINALPNLAFGIGYDYKNKYSIELRLNRNREVFGRYAHWTSKYNTFSIIFGYQLF